MTERRRQFFNELAALMERYDVEMEVREDCRNYQCSADGIDFEFNSLPWLDSEDVDSRDPERDYDTVTYTGRYFDAGVIRSLAEDEA